MSKWDEFVRRTKTDADVERERAERTARMEMARREAVTKARSEIDTRMKEMATRLLGRGGRVERDANTHDYTLASPHVDSTLKVINTADGETAFVVDGRPVVVVRFDTSKGVLVADKGGGVAAATQVASVDDLVIDVVFPWAERVGLLLPAEEEAEIPF